MQTTTAVGLLEQAYDTVSFRQWGHELIDLLANHLERLQNNPEEPVIPYRDPAEELAFWQHDFLTLGDPVDLFGTVLAHSVQVHHPRYLGHQVSVPALAASLAGLVSDVLSNGTGVYEMGMASNALERVVIEWLAAKIGYPAGAGGFLTSGGTLANLTALLAARRANAPSDVWEQGHAERLAVLVSEEAHYCIDRAARIMGLGREGIIKVPVNERYEIRTDLLETYRQRAIDVGLHIFAVVGCAASTSTGSYDDLSELADFCEQHRFWLHVDGAHGGAAALSPKYRHLTAGIERADSVAIDFHKMLMTPALTTALVFKRGADAAQTFAQNAQYLWDTRQSPEWYHSGKRTFECTKLMMSLKIYTILKTYGERIFAENVERLYDLGQRLAALVRARPALELALEPVTNIVNFRYANAPADRLDTLNTTVRQALVTSGKFYIVQTTLQEKRYLRAVVMNALTTEADFDALLNEVERLGAEHLANNNTN